MIFEQYKAILYMANQMYMSLSQTLKGNVDRESVGENVISPPVTARYVRFNPVHWNVRGGVPNHDICMRVGVFTCTGEDFSIKYGSTINSHGIIIINNLYTAHISHIVKLSKFYLCNLKSD